MLKKCLALMLAGMLLGIVNVGSTTVLAKGKNRPLTVEQVKEKIAKRGTGEKARVSVKMLDGTKMKGYVSEAGEDSFVLTDSKTQQVPTIAYREVTEVKGSKGMSKAAWVGIGAAIGVTALVIAIKASGPIIDFGGPR